MKCKYCADSIPLTKLKHQYIHRVGWSNIVCTEAGFGTADPGAWSECRPYEWIPRRIRRNQSEKKEEL